MSEPSFTFCSRMVVEYEKVVNLLRYMFGIWIFNKIFIFFFFSDHFVQTDVLDIFAPSLKPFYSQICGHLVQVYMANLHQV